MAQLLREVSPLDFRVPPLDSLRHRRDLGGGGAIRRAEPEDWGGEGRDSGEGEGGDSSDGEGSGESGGAAVLWLDEEVWEVCGRRRDDGVGEGGGGAEGGDDGGGGECRGSAGDDGGGVGEGPDSGAGGEVLGGGGAVSASGEEVGNGEWLSEEKAWLFFLIKLN